jgi:hypothetical protein
MRVVERSGLFDRVVEIYRTKGNDGWLDALPLGPYAVTIPTYVPGWRPWIVAPTFTWHCPLIIVGLPRFCDATPAPAFGDVADGKNSIE